MSLLTKILIAGATCYGLVVLAAFLGQRSLMYFPDRTRVAPTAAGLAGVLEVEIATPDGERLIAWHAPARAGRPTLLYFHGNGGNLDARSPRIARFMGEGWGVFMLAYRGYSGSTGSPSERANVADAGLAYDWLINAGVPARRLIVYGESLGTGVATQLAGSRSIAGLVLDAPYTSTTDVGAQAYPFLPVRLLMRDRYETVLHIKKISAPVLVLHGERDEVIPVGMGRAVHAAANAPKSITTFPRGGHNDLYINGNDALAVLRTWIGGLKLD
jgi:fermentation-respiration switch protein FrsA (DUF1100 family)